MDKIINEHLIKMLDDLTVFLSAYGVNLANTLADDEMFELCDTIAKYRYIISERNKINNDI